MNFLRFLLSASLLGALAAAGPLAAQPGSAPDAVSMTTTLAYSARTDLDRDGQSLGEVAVTAFLFGLESSSALTERTRLGYGLDYGLLSLDSGAGAPLPDKLQSLAVPLSVGGPLAANWVGRLMLHPGFYGSGGGLAGRAFNAPLVVLATYRQSAELSWTLGFRYDSWSEYPLLPFVGTNWKFAPDWELSVGVPRTGVSWQFHPDAILRLGATYRGGSYAVDEDPRPTGSALPFLGRTRLDYREIRVGAALDLFSRESVSVGLEAGLIVNQRFDYDRADFQIDGDGAAYVSLSARFRF